jgi:predicted  nucleic acid-binding Zn-ribbon protein
MEQELLDLKKQIQHLQQENKLLQDRQNNLLYKIPHGLTSHEFAEAEKIINEWNKEIQSNRLMFDSYYECLTNCINKKILAFLKSYYSVNYKVKTHDMFSGTWTTFFELYPKLTY